MPLGTTSTSCHNKLVSNLHSAALILRLLGSQVVPGRVHTKEGGRKKRKLPVVTRQPSIGCVVALLPHAASCHTGLPVDVVPAAPHEQVSGVLVLLLQG